MKKLVSILFVVLMVNVSFGATWVSEDFESYADKAALDAVWVPISGGGYLLNTTIAHSGTQSAEIPSGAAQFNLSSHLTTDVTIEYWEYIDTANSIDPMAWFEVWGGSGLHSGKTTTTGPSYTVIWDDTGSTPYDIVIGTYIEGWNHLVWYVHPDACIICLMLV